MKGLILISTVAFSLASFAASASEAPSESVCSLTHLKQVADILLDNAAKYASPDSTVRVILRQSQGIRQRRL